MKLFLRHLLLRLKVFYFHFQLCLVWQVRQHSSVFGNMILDIREVFISTKANENNILFKPFAMLRCEMLFNFPHSMPAFDLFSVSGVGDWKLFHWNFARNNFALRKSPSQKNHSSFFSLLLSIPFPIILKGWRYLHRLFDHQFKYFQYLLSPSPTPLTSVLILEIAY